MNVGVDPEEQSWGQTCSPEQDHWVAQEGAVRVGMGAAGFLAFRLECTARLPCLKWLSPPPLPLQSPASCNMKKGKGRVANPANVDQALHCSSLPAAVLWGSRAQTLMSKNNTGRKEVGVYMVFREGSQVSSHRGVLQGLWLGSLLWDN